MTNIDKLFEQQYRELSESEEWHDLALPNQLWKSDPLFSNYHACSTKQKGKIGEFFVGHFMKLAGHKVERPHNPGHDRIISGYKTEIKFSLATTKNKQIAPSHFMINHVSKGKDWERLIFCGINPIGDPNRVVLLYAEKKDLLAHMNTITSVFKHQQAGKKGQNDDYICCVTPAVLAESFWKEISQW